MRPNSRNATGAASASLASPGEAGEALGLIGADVRSNFTGYADKAATEKKVLHDVFTKGDAWFRTGDLMRQDSEGYFYFVDRIGDTFRWKGENVSTNEVSERLGEVEGVKDANVYGVEIPGADGRAGMAALTTGKGFSIEALATHVTAALPPYAQPVFIRIQQEIETTGTFKYRKVDLVEQGFDPSKVGRRPALFQTGRRLHAARSRRIYSPAHHRGRVPVLGLWFPHNPVSLGLDPRGGCRAKLILPMESAGTLDPRVKPEGDGKMEPADHA